MLILIPTHIPNLILTEPELQLRAITLTPWVLFIGFGLQIGHTFAVDFVPVNNTYILRQSSIHIFISVSTNPRRSPSDACASMHSYTHSPPCTHQKQSLHHLHTRLASNYCRSPFSMHLKTNSKSFFSAIPFSRVGSVLKRD